MIIKIFCLPCEKCRLLAMSVNTVAADLGFDFELKQIKDDNLIRKAGIAVTPGLVVNNKLRCAGRVPTLRSLEAMFLYVLKQEKFH